MSREHVRMAVAAALATALGTCALRPVFATGGWFPPALATVLTVLVGGLLLRGGAPVLWSLATGGRAVPRRLRRAGAAAVPLGQLALLTGLLTALYAPGEAVLGVLPTRASLADLGAVFAEGSAELREQAPPALPLTGLLALTALLVGLVAVAVDLVAVAGRQAALAGLGLLALFCVPVSTITGGIGLVALAAPAAGLALLLWADQDRRLTRRDRLARPSALGPGAGAALRTVAVALAAGLVVGAVVPTLSEGSFASGFGNGTGTGRSTGTSLDPVAALQGQLTRPEPIDLLRVDASVPDPGYLRAVALDQYDSEDGWTISNLDGQTAVAGVDRLAPLPSREGSRLVTATVRAIAHDDRFLPVLYSPLSVRVDGAGDEDWRFDPATGTVFGRNATSAEQSYQVAASEPRPSAEELAGSPTLQEADFVRARFTSLPTLDPAVQELVDQLTAGVEGPYARVRAINDYLTDRSNGFVYSLSTAPGTSGDDLADFLRLKRGYCEQYAGAMAVLVRAAGVPARVALGYTPGQAQDDGSRLVTSDDAHAWVEAYFDGLGWVPFDPTPIDAGRAVELSWAPRAADQEDPDVQDGLPEPTAAPQAGPADRPDRDNEIQPVAAPEQNSLAWVRPVLVGLGAALLAGALIAVPAAVRALQRRRRLAAGTAGALWDELSATARDLGVRPRPVATPRQTARQLAAVLTAHGASGDGPDRGDRAGGWRGGALRLGNRRTGGGRSAALDAVRRLALAEEAASYGPAGASGTVPAELAVALQTARRGLWAALPRRARLRGLLWPESLVAGTLPELVARGGQRLTALGRRRTRAV